MQFDGSPAAPANEKSFWWGSNVTAIHIGPSAATTNDTLVMSTRTIGVRVVNFETHSAIIAT